MQIDPQGSINSYFCAVSQQSIDCVIIIANIIDLTTFILQPKVSFENAFKVCSMIVGSREKK